MIHQWKNTVPSFILTPLQFQPGACLRNRNLFYLPVDISSVLRRPAVALCDWFCAFASLLLNQAVSINQMMLTGHVEWYCDSRLDAAEAVPHPIPPLIALTSFSSSGVLSSRPFICIYSPETLARVPYFSWVIRLLEYFININIW